MSTAITALRTATSRRLSGLEAAIRTYGALYSSSSTSKVSPAKSGRRSGLDFPSMLSTSSASKRMVARRAAASGSPMTAMEPMVPAVRYDSTSEKVPAVSTAICLT